LSERGCLKTEGHFWCRPCFVVYSGTIDSYLTDLQEIVCRRRTPQQLQKHRPVGESC
jgi:hypothetical protein